MDVASQSCPARGIGAGLNAGFGTPRFGLPARGASFGAAVFDDAGFVTGAPGVLQQRKPVE